MRVTIPPLLVILFGLAIWSCGEDPQPAEPPKPASPSPTEREPEPAEGDPEELEEEYGKPGSAPEDPWAAYDEGSPYRHPESLLKPMDGFPLPRGARIVSQDRNLAVYEVSADVRKVEAFYRERGFHITRPGKLPGYVATRTDAGTQLQVQPGKNRLVMLRFYR